MSRKPILVKMTDMPSLESYSKMIKMLWKSKWITNNGTYAKQLTEKLKAYLGVSNLALLNNGTLTLHIALKTLNLPKGGEIITTPFTFVATTSTIVWEGFTPVFVDINPKTWNIEPEAIEKAITAHTVAIMPVHVYGNPCDVEAIDRIAKKYNLKVVYDAAHAFGVKYKNKSILNYGNFSSLSFHATKVFHTIEGGALVTTSKKLNDLVERTRNFGIIEFKEAISLAGTNAKMNEFQAAMGLCNIPNLKKNLSLRKKYYSLYIANLSKNKAIRFQEIVASEYNYAYMPICFQSKTIRDRVVQRLESNSIFPRKYFYPLTSSFDRYTSYRHDNLKVATDISNGILCLPLHSELSINDINTISSIILSAL